jgi:glutaredoxin 3
MLPPRQTSRLTQPATSAEIDLYTRASCPQCVALKAALQARGVAYNEYDISDEKFLARVKNNFPEIKNLPILAIRTTVIAGIDELVVLIENDQVKYL